MSNSTLNNTTTGRAVIRDLFRHLSERAIGRRLRRKYIRFYRNWFFGDHAAQYSESLGTIVAELNAAHDLDEQAYRVLGARYGAFPESVQNEVYYVDPENGSDTTGNGTTSHPYASLWFLPYFFPKRIDHQYRVVIRSDISLETLQINQEFGPDGSLAFIGEGAAIVGDTRIVDAGIVTYDGFEHVPMTVGGLSDDQYTSWFMKRNSDDQAHPIWYHNAAAQFKTPIGWSGSSPAEADVMEFVRPAIRMTVAGLSIGGSSPMMTRDIAGVYYGARIGFFNLDIDVRGTAKKPAVHLHTSSGVSCSFCRFLYDDSVQRTLELRDSSINLSFHLDREIEVYAQSGVSNISLVDLPGATTPAGVVLHNTADLSSGNVPVRVLGNSSIRHLSCRQGLSVEEFGSATLDSCALNTLSIRDANAYLDNVGLGWRPSGHTVELYTGNLRWSAVSFFCWGGIGAATNKVRIGGDVTRPGISSIGGLSVDEAGSIGASWSAYGVEVRSPAFLFFRATPAPLTGGLADILFATPTIVVPLAWPAPGAAISDGIGTAFASVHA
jgi:hypothetical protein